MTLDCLCRQKQPGERITRWVWNHVWLEGQAESSFFKGCSFKNCRKTDVWPPRCQWDVVLKCLWNGLALTVFLRRDRHLRRSRFSTALGDGVKIWGDSEEGGLDQEVLPKSGQKGMEPQKHCFLPTPWSCYTCLRTEPSAQCHQIMTSCQDGEEG